jgi:hypothetical protein
LLNSRSPSGSFAFSPNLLGCCDCLGTSVPRPPHCKHGIIEQRALVTLGNEASARVLSKAGFIRSRVIADNDMIRGVKHDEVEYVRKRPRRRDDLRLGSGLRSPFPA